jgi:hypothetical protein
MLFTCIYIDLINNKFRCDYDAPFSALLSAELFGSSMPFVIRHQPHLTVQTLNPVRSIASKTEVRATM